MPCYHTRASEHTQYATVLHCRSEQKYGRKAQQQNGHTELSNKKLFFFCLLRLGFLRNDLITSMTDPKLQTWR